MKPSIVDIKLNKVLPLTLRAAKTAAQIQADLRKKGKEIGHTDTLNCRNCISK